MSQIATNQTSLLAAADGAPAQLSLLDCDQDLVEELTKGKEGLFTGELLFERDPEKYKLVVAAMAGGLSIRKTAKALKISPGTIRAIKAREGLTIGAHKKEIVRTLQSFVAAGAERLLEEIDDIPIANLPLALGIAVDKMQLLAGEATSIEETRHSVSLEDFNSFVEAIQSGAGNTGINQQEKSPKGARPAGRIVDAEPLDLGELETDANGADSPSVGFKPDAEPCQ